MPEALVHPWSHLVGGVRIPRADPAFPPVAYSRPVGARPKRAFAILSTPQHQAHASSCLPHAFIGALESEVKARTGADYQGSIQDCYFGARWLVGDETQDRGSFPGTAAQWLREYGSVSSVRAPYDPNTVTTWRPKPEWAAERRLLTADMPPIPASIDQILAEPAEGRCVPVCHHVFDQMGGQASITGIETGPDAGGSRGGHCRNVCGYDDEVSVQGFGQGVVWVWNWWKGWGKPHPLADTDSRYAAFRDSFSMVPYSVLTDPRWSFDFRRINRGLAVEA